MPTATTFETDTRHDGKNANSRTRRYIKIYFTTPNCAAVKQTQVNITKAENTWDKK